MEDRPLTTRVILVRHGESSYNVERRVQGHCDESTLTEAGRTSARQVGEALRDITFHTAYSSPLKRARETAELIAASLSQAPNLQFTDQLKEINLVLWEGMLFTDVQAKFPESYHQWLNEPHNLSMEVPGEDGQMQEFMPVVALFEQARQFWQEILPRHGGQTVLIVAHSGINRALIASAIGLGPESYQAIQQSNCGISVLNFAGTLGDRVQIEALNITAHLGEKLPKPRSGHTGPRLLLVRHGETDWNRQKRFQGQIDVPLNDTGRAQSGKAAEFLQSVQLDGAVSSPMLRPKETAEIILQHHPHITLQFEDNLREINHGEWEGKFEEEIEASFPGDLAKWHKTPAEMQMPNGENLDQVWERAIAAWDAIVARAASPDQFNTIMVVAHDAINKAILAYVLGLGPESFWSFRQGNGAVSVIDYPRGADSKPILQAMNITIHLSGSVLDKTAAGAL